MIPQDYTAWHQCITIICSIKLNASFITARIQALENKNDANTQIFIHLYGDQHYQNILSLFYQAKQTVKV